MNQFQKGKPEPGDKNANEILISKGGKAVDQEGNPAGNPVSEENRQTRLFEQMKAQGYPLSVLRYPVIRYPVIPLSDI